jgi:AcrR family transcriptional regulator
MPKRSLPTPRREGMENIIRATVELLKNRPPQDVTLRDVAEASGHHHRMVIEWFGGKGGLYNAVFNEIFQPLVDSGELISIDIALREDVRTAFRLLDYIQMHHPEYITEFRTGFVIKAVEQRLINFQGWTPKEASLLARRLAAHTIGLVLFREAAGLSDDETLEIMRQEFARLAKTQPPPQG